jgi:hypothetical protein
MSMIEVLGLNTTLQWAVRVSSSAPWDQKPETEFRRYQLRPWVPSMKGRPLQWASPGAAQSIRFSSDSVAKVRKLGRSGIGGVVGSDCDPVLRLASFPELARSALPA